MPISYADQTVHTYTFIKSNIIAFVLPDLCIRCPQKEIWVLLGVECRLIRLDKKIFLHKTIYCCDLLESPRGGDSNRWSKYIILLRIDGNYPKHLFESGLMQGLSRKTLSYVKVSLIRRCSRNDVC